MRFVGAMLAVAIAFCPAAAQNASPAKPKPPAARPASKPAAKPKPAAAATAAARAGYAALSESERMTIQSDLIWTGDYNGVIAVEFSDRAIAAVKAFQKRHGGRETGILSADERQKLAQEAKPKRESAGWQLVDDSATGAWLGLPAKLVPQASATKSGTHWQSARGETQVDTFRITGTTLAAAFERMKKEPAERKVEYNVMRSDFFVISGLQGLKKFYVRAQFKDGEVRGVTILYDQALEGIMDPITVAMSNAFFPFPGGPLTGVLLPPGPPPRPKVEYASGIVVSAAGHIVTDRQVVEGCQTITVPGLGPAERLAADRTAGLALLRVYGARGLSPAAIADAPAKGPSATLLGIADPQMQGGGNAVTAVPAQLVQNGAVRALEPAPAIGFSGSAALDPDARLIGMVGLKTPDVTGATAPRAALVPADSIRTFLYAQSVAPHSGRATIDETKAAIVRVICVRR